MKAILSALEAIQPQGDFCARFSEPVDDLQIRVGDAPPLTWPLTHAAASALIERARPAKFGWRDQTLQDHEVRNTWEIPKSRVKIDKRRWNKTLNPLLVKVRDALGLDVGAMLSASLHNMLIYEEGQFFQPHQDSEKADGMVATLVVALPCAHTGGSLVVDHAGTKKRLHTSRTADDRLACIAFYADCHHEVRPVTSGYRVVLTYNLLLKSRVPPVAIAFGNAAVVPLTRALRDYFDQRTDELQSRSTDERRLPRPAKWVYLLDHQYTGKSLGWAQLKNGDRLKSAAIAQAAAELGLERYIALADVHECWDCEDDYDYRYRSRHRYRYDDDDDECDDEEANGDERYTLVDLIDSDVSLRHWVGDDIGKADFSGLGIDDGEVCWTRASDEFDPFSSEYEGWMGNYGNTLERWYHRAAIVLWRREDHHAMLCEIDPGQLVMNLRKLARKSATRVEAQKIVAGVMPFWPRAIIRQREVNNTWTKSVFDLALRIELPDTAQALVEPFGLTVLNAATARVFSALERQYGAPWTLRVLKHWTPQKRGGWQRLELIAAFYSLVLALRAAGMSGVDGASDEGLERRDSGVIAWLCRYQFDTLVAQDAQQQRHDSPASLAAQGDSRVDGAGELLNACVAAGDAAMHRRIASYLVGQGTLYDPLALGDLSLRLEQTDGETSLWGYQTLRQYAVNKLADECGKSVRDPDDWAIAQTVSCICADCKTLNAFLHSHTERQKVWPLAEQRRVHIHSAIDGLGVPVTHDTRREGRPYRLVLVKTGELRQREALRRERVVGVLAKLSVIA